MALLDLKQYRYNDYLNKVESTVKSIDAVPNRGRNFNCIGCEPQRTINVEDVVIIGGIPKNCVVTDIRALYDEDFVAGTTFDLGFLNDALEIVPFASGVVADGGIVTQYLPLSNDGVRDPLGVQVLTAERDFRGSIWNGDKKPLTLAMQFKGGAAGTPLKAGKMKLLISFIRYGEEDIHRGQRIPAVANYTD